MDDGCDLRQLARARARLALRAEQAWGMTAVSGVAHAPLGREAGNPAVQAARELSDPGDANDAEVATATPIRLPPPSQAPPRGHDARAAADPPAPVVDLFGNTAGTKPASLAADDPPFTDPPPSRARRIELLKALDDSEVKGCTKCPLHASRTSTVFGEGDPEAPLLFIGEGPGENEDLSGRPFVGKAGQKLDEMIRAMGLTRERVYIANVVKCRPPNNRVPTPPEVNMCTPYLHKQIEWIRPRVIVTLGLPATRHLLKSSLPMGKLRGQWNQWRGIKVMPTYHPAYLLRSYTPANRRVVWSDLQQVMAALGLKRRDGPAP